MSEQKIPTRTVAAVEVDPMNKYRVFLLFQCRDGAFPSELWLGVSREAISVYKRGEPWPLEVFPYEQILSFGAPLPNTYKIAVEGRELVFETQMVGTTQQMHKPNIHLVFLIMVE